MNRRDLLAGFGAAAAFPVAGSALAAVADKTPDPSAALTPLGRAAYWGYIYSLPLIESALARGGLMAAVKGTPGNMYHMRAPTTPATQRVTTPNNDTMNSRGWYDLDQGPVRVSWPATGDRYVSVAVMDMYSNNFVVLGSRTTGPNGGSFVVVGPRGEAPAGAIRSPTRWMWILLRTLTTGGADLVPARAFQDAFKVEAPAYRGNFGTYATRDAAWADYFASVARLMAENPGPATDTAILQRMAPLGLDRFDPKRFDAGQVREIEAGVGAARKLLLAQTIKGQTVAGWMYSRAAIGDFRQDYLYRAQTALNGFAALPSDEAMYLFGAGQRGELKYDSAVPWRLRIRGDQLPPSDAFWSLVMYRATPDGQFRLFDNPIDRYSVGDRTAGLKRGADGTIDILMQREAPPASAAVNWLPTPRDAPFGTVFRIYRPQQPVIDGVWRLPALERA